MGLRRGLVLDGAREITPYYNDGNLHDFLRVVEALWNVLDAAVLDAARNS